VGAITSTEFKEVGITLEVTGTITDGNNIFLTLNAQQSVQTGESGGVPVVDAREVDTSLMLKDGEIVVMGGLRRQEKINQADQIPILGDIPLVGLLFKYTNTVFNNTELIVFVSPHIYKEGEPIDEDAMAKFNEIRDRPMLSLPDEAKLKEPNEKFEQRVEQQAAALEKLQLEITESERAEAELRESRAALEKNIKDQAGTNEQLQQDLAKCKQQEDDLRERRGQIEQRIEQQSAANKQLQSQERLGKVKVEESELSEHRKLLKQRLEQQTAVVEQLQQEITKRRQAERDVTKKMLLGRIKVLQARNDEDAVKELLSTLHSLDEILGQEIKEALNSSAKNVADSGK